MKKSIFRAISIFAGIQLLVSCSSVVSSSSFSTVTPSTPHSSSSGFSTVTPSIPHSSSENRPVIKDKNLTIFSVNDTHGAIEHVPNSVKAGLAKVREAIYADPDYDKDNSIILAAGDMLQGTGLSNISKGVAITEVMNSFPFDAMTIGNHEFDWGLESTLSELGKVRTFDIISNNISRKDGQPLDGVKPSILLNKGGYKVGVIGSIAKDIQSSIAYNQVKPYVLLDDYYLTLAEANTLKDRGADLVVLLSHQSLTSNITRIADSGLVDAIFLGHSHSYLNDSIIAGTGKTVPTVQGKANAEAYTKVVFNKDNLLVKQDVIKFSVVSANDLKVAPEVQLIIDKHNEASNEVLNEVVVKTNGSFMRYESSSNSGSMNKLITKTMYDYGLAQGLDNLVAVHNVGGIRSNFLCSTSICDFRYRDLYEISPFDNEVRFVKIKGNKLVSAIKSHAYYGIDISSETFVNGEKLDFTKTYNVLTIDFLTTTPGYPLYAENGGDYPGGELVFIREALKIEWKKLEMLNIADFPF